MSTSTLTASLETIDQPQPTTLYPPILSLCPPLPVFDPTAPPQPAPSTTSNIEPTPSHTTHRPKIVKAPSSTYLNNSRKHSNDNSHLNAEAGPSTPPRYLFVAVRRGHNPGVYSHWREAESQLLVSDCNRKESHPHVHLPCPCLSLVHDILTHPHCQVLVCHGTATQHQASSNCNLP